VENKVQKNYSLLYNVKLDDIQDDDNDLKLLDTIIKNEVSNEVDDISTNSVEDMAKVNDAVKKQEVNNKWDGDSVKVN
jgi:hypothetical protein